MGLKKTFSTTYLTSNSAGEVWAFQEGEIFSPNEPIVRVTAPIIEAQLIESFILNTVNVQTMITTKASKSCERCSRQIRD